MVENFGYSKVSQILKETAENFTVHQSEDLSEAAFYDNYLKILNNQSFEQFYFINDYSLNTTLRGHGVGAMLGYSEHQFTFEQFLKIIHPSHFISSFFFERELINQLFSEKWEVGFRHPSLIFIIALKNYHGQYELYKRILSPFNTSSQKRARSTINEFIKLKAFNSEPCHVRIGSSLGRKFEMELFEQVAQAFERTKIYSTNELRLLRMTNASDASLNEMAQRLRITHNTVKTMVGRILRKSEVFFNRSFDGLRNVVSFLSDESLI